jgi:hypothetical protein
VSEDTTKDLSKKYDTKPTIETVPERINEMRGELLGEINGVRGEMNGMRGEMNGMRSEISGEIRKLRAEMQVGFDRIESIASGTRAEFLTLRADFRELKQALGEHIPALKS